MRLAWFRTSPPDRDNRVDDAAQLIAALESRHAVEVIDEARAHDVVWRHARGAFDAVVYELEDGADNSFIWPYLLHIPGLLYLRACRLVTSRSAALLAERHPEHLAVERAFDTGTWPMLGIPVLASTMTAVPHSYLADSLRLDFPGARIRHMRPGIRELSVPSRPGNPPLVTIGVVAAGSRERGVMARAAQRARDTGASFALTGRADVLTTIEQSDVVFVLDWRVSGAAQAGVLAAMSAGRPTVVYDVRETADWPSLDPQTWRPRVTFQPDPGACVSIDMQDEEHSLMLALRRLSADASLRAALGSEARRWWRRHGTLDAAVDRFEQVLGELQTAPAPVRPADWPAHLAHDGSENVRQIIDAFGISVDILN